MDIAFSIAEKFVADNFPSKIVFLKRGGKWRQTPASPNQLKYLEKLGVTIPEGAPLTKNDASVMIDSALRKHQQQSFLKPSSP